MPDVVFRGGAGDGHRGVLKEGVVDPVHGVESHMAGLPLANTAAVANGVAGEMTRRPAAAWEAGVLVDRSAERLINSVSDYIAVQVPTKAPAK
jgi:hypothetical protein